MTTEPVIDEDGGDPRTRWRWLRPGDPEPAPPTFAEHLRWLEGADPTQPPPEQPAPPAEGTR